jgi:hypothetical protein
MLATEQQQAMTDRANEAAMRRGAQHRAAAAEERGRLIC